ncbi:hypothetical protein K7957_02160 [Sphingomonas yunnanensis]|uniref:hypothetical protein n=1 Tax=Sphingomonas yunnanensis TaxID=310400 RepID=UPI001CA65208|nr:hypothetical protein [Sphingomonas yunnanensis]MBY9061735.1 hypothetical protein [Sphingomonas yunnanensis]
MIAAEIGPSAGPFWRGTMTDEERVAAYRQHSDQARQIVEVIDDEARYQMAGGNEKTRDVTADFRERHVRLADAMEQLA